MPHRDIFNPLLTKEVPAFDVTLEQWDAIDYVLKYSCSDSRFAQKAHDAIWHILMTPAEIMPESQNRGMQLMRR